MEKGTNKNKLRHVFWKLPRIELIGRGLTDFNAKTTITRDMMKLKVYSCTVPYWGNFLSAMWFGRGQALDWLVEDAGSQPPTPSSQTSCAGRPPKMSSNAQIVHTTASAQELPTLKEIELVSENYKLCQQVFHVFFFTDKLCTFIKIG